MWKNLALMGAVAVSATGNDLANLVTGNAIANEILGAGGNDTLNGGIGGDTLVGGLGDDLMVVDDLGDASCRVSPPASIRSRARSASRSLRTSRILKLMGSARHQRRGQRAGQSDHRQWRREMPLLGDAGK